MAKQSGIHQIKGKVGVMSYYKTKGVVGGLIRSINQGLSARVKTDEAYANTRLNNQEFKNANAIATAAFNSVNTRKRGMMVNFAVAKMTKKALEDIKQGSGNWGYRKPYTELDALISDMLENYAKGGAYDGQFGSVVVTPATVDDDPIVTFTLSEELQQSLIDNGVNGVIFRLSLCLAGETSLLGLPVLLAGHAIAGTEEAVITATDTITVQIATSITGGESVGMTAAAFTAAQQDPKHGFYGVVTILPYREVSGQAHIMQELCTYVALPFGQRP